MGYAMIRIGLKIGMKSSIVNVPCCILGMFHPDEGRKPFDSLLIMTGR